MCFPQLQGIVRQSRIYLDLFSYVSLHTCSLHTKTWHQTLRGTFSLWRKTSVYISGLPWTCIACVLNAPWEAKNTVSKCLFFFGLCLIFHLLQSGKWMSEKCIIHTTEFLLYYVNILLRLCAFMGAFMIVSKQNIISINNEPCPSYMNLTC